MTDTCSIEFTGKVTRVHEFDDNALINVASDFGGKYPKKCVLNVKALNGICDGDSVRVVPSEPPSAKVKSWTKQDGEEVTFAEITYWNPKVERLGDAREDAPAAYDDSDEIPFAFPERIHTVTRVDGHEHHRARRAIRI